jgi:preprotein translocase subunit SecA
MKVSQKFKKYSELIVLYDSSNVRTLYHLEQALRAEAVYKRDKNYVVTNEGEVVIVDEFTGRCCRVGAIARVCTKRLKQKKRLKFSKNL